jgi:hypothetical protein
MYTGNENHTISLADASALTARYRQQFAPGSCILGEYFGKQAIQSLLNQTSCVGTRIYYGLDESNVPKLILVGVDANGNDMTQGAILEFGYPCPPNSSTSNPLNT